ncbi:DUF5710 domain-containing protein [Geomonas subterranea]|uniref:DUF5710 domain-containing protein n=1 Tax=Geomonas subterranea TaxID=2847989 RepID=UPI001CD2E3FE|nr:DUF5710 domain-containing protein [Geomonas fuzhouensis]
MKYLDVPSNEEDAAKELGAKFDADSNRWFVPDGLCTSDFNLWLPVEPNIQLVAPIFLVTSANRCYSCNEISVVHCLGSKAVFDLDDQEEIEGENPVLISNLSIDEPEIERAISEVAPLYNVDLSKTQGQQVYMNHCEKCGAKLGDFFLHSEPGGAFFPTDEHPEMPLQKKVIVEAGRFTCSGSYRYPL